MVVWCVGRLVVWCLVVIGGVGCVGCVGGVGSVGGVGGVGGVSGVGGGGVLVLVAYFLMGPHPVGWCVGVLVRWWCAMRAPPLGGAGGAGGVGGVLTGGVALVVWCVLGVGVLVSMYVCCMGAGATWWFGVLV